MKINTMLSSVAVTFIMLLLSCKGTTESSSRTAGEDRKPAEALPAKRLIEVITPADNATFSCTTPLSLSLTKAAGAENADSVQLWAGNRRIKTLTTLPATVDIPSAGAPGRISLRAVAYSSASKPQTVALFVTLVSDIVPEIYRYKVVKAYPHDRRAFTQGLVYCDGWFYEGTGQPGESSLRKVDPLTGEIISQLNLEESLFGEGVAVMDDRIYQLTWTTKVGFVYDKKTFTQVNKIYYQTQGWGLATLGDSLVMSDGSNTIWFMDQDFNTLGSVEVWDNKGKVDNLNELEMIEGELWANIWQTDRIARIDPGTGKVLGYVELGNLLPREDRHPETDVLNGIAYDNEGKRIFVTGKYWPRLFEIKVIPQGRN